MLSTSIRIVSFGSSSKSSKLSCKTGLFIANMEPIIRSPFLSMRLPYSFHSFKACSSVNSVFGKFSGSSVIITFFFTNCFFCWILFKDRAEPALFAIGMLGKATGFCIGFAVAFSVIASAETALVGFSCIALLVTSEVVFCSVVVFVAGSFLKKEAGTMLVELFFFRLVLI